MKVVLGVLLILFLLLAGGFWLLARTLKRMARSRATHELVESFDTGLAIPMRDSDTRRPAKERS